MKYFILFMFIISSTCLAQKKYQFNYLLEYQFISYQDSGSNRNFYYITNSLDNSYFSKIEDLDSLNFEIEIRDQDQIWTKVQINKEDFLKAETLTVPCNINYSYKNDFKFRIKEYEFSTLNDTVIKGKSFTKYQLQYTGKRKKKKSFPVGTNHYIIKDSTEYHLPVLTHSTAFEEWKEERNIPNGIFKEKIYYDYNNNLNYKYILKGIYKINKNIILLGECNEEK